VRFGSPSGAHPAPAPRTALEGEPALPALRAALEGEADWARECAPCALCLARCWAMCRSMRCSAVRPGSKGPREPVAGTWAPYRPRAFAGEWLPQLVGVAHPSVAIVPVWSRG
jgi:hypothetical protein